LAAAKKKLLFGHTAEKKLNFGRIFNTGEGGYFQA
jgi:hypothetical protein